MDNETLGTAYPKELLRVSELLGMYRATHDPHGERGHPVNCAFAIGSLHALLAEATTALACGDTVAMIRLFPRLEESVNE